MRIVANGFEPGCRHALWLLPVTDFNLMYACAGCRGTVVAGSSQVEGKSLDEAGAFVAGALGDILGTGCTYAGAATAKADEQVRQVLAKLGIEWPFEEEDEDAQDAEPDGSSER